MRAVIYIRVSKEEQVEGWSLDAQRDKCLELAQKRGYHVTKLYCEPGRSAKTDLRPTFQRMMSDAEAGRFDVIMVQKLDRFSRNLLDVVKNVGRLRAPNVRLISTSEEWIDTTTPMGELMLVLFATLAQWDNENRSRETSKGKEARAKAGYWNGSLSFGYSTPGKLKSELMKLGKKFEAGEIDEALYSTLSTELEKHIERMQNIDDNEPILHPRNAAGAMLAFSTYAEGGKSDNDIALLLNEHGYRTTGTHGERLFEGDSVQDLLQNRFYIGEVQYKGTYYQGRQPALIPKALFEKCQEVRVTRHGRAARRPSTKRVYPLSRIAVCARCGQPMRGQFGELYRYYRDPTRTIHQCTQRQIRADQTERMLIDYLSRIQLPEDWRQRVLEMSLGNQSKLQDVERRRASLEKQLTRAKNLYQLGDIEEAEYHALRIDLKTKLAAMEPVQEPDVEWAAELLGNLPKLLKSATLEELQEIFRSLLKTVYLDSGPRGPVVAIEPRPFVKQLLDVAVMKASRRDIEVRWSKKKVSDDDHSGSVETVSRGVFGNHENSDTMAFDAGEEYVAKETWQPVSSALATLISSNAF